MNYLIIITGLVLILALTLIAVILVYRKEQLKEEQRKHLEKDMEEYVSKKKYSCFDDFLEDPQNKMSITDYIDSKVSKLNARELETMWIRATKKK